MRTGSNHSSNLTAILVHYVYKFVSKNIKITIEQKNVSDLSWSTPDLGQPWTLLQFEGLWCLFPTASSQFDMKSGEINSTILRFGSGDQNFYNFKDLVILQL